MKGAAIIASTSITGVHESIVQTCTSQDMTPVTNLSFPHFANRLTRIKGNELYKYFSKQETVRAWTKS